MKAPRRRDAHEEGRRAEEESELSSGMLYATGSRRRRLARRRPHRLRRVLRRPVLKMEKPTLLEKLDLGQKLLPGLQERARQRRHPRAVVFAVLCVLLVNNARKKLDA